MLDVVKARAYKRDDGVWMIEVKKNLYVNEISARVLGYIA